MELKRLEGWGQVAEQLGAAVTAVCQAYAKNKHNSGCPFYLLHT